MKVIAKVEYTLDLDINHHDAVRLYPDIKYPAIPLEAMAMDVICTLGAKKLFDSCEPMVRDVMVFVEDNDD